MQQMVHSPRLTVAGLCLPIPEALCSLHGCSPPTKSPLGVWSHFSFALRGGHWFPLRAWPCDAAHSAGWDCCAPPGLLFCSAQEYWINSHPEAWCSCSTKPCPFCRGKILTARGVCVCVLPTKRYIICFLLGGSGWSVLPVSPQNEQQAWQELPRACLCLPVLVHGVKLCASNLCAGHTSGRDGNPAEISRVPPCSFCVGGLV